MYTLVTHLLLYYYNLLLCHSNVAPT